MSTILEMILLRFKVFEYTVRKVIVFSLNYIFFGNSTIHCFIYTFSLAAPLFSSAVPCFNFFWQVFLIHTSHHWNRSAMPCIGISATATDYFWEGVVAERGASEYLCIMSACPKLQNVDGKA